LIRYGNCFINTAYSTVVVLHIAKKEVQLSSEKSIRACEVFMTCLAVMDCNLIVQVGVVNLDISVERH